MTDYTIRLAKPEDAEAIRQIQAETWIATYPNAELGITEGDIRRYILGERNEMVLQRRERTRDRIVDASARKQDWVALSDDAAVGWCLAYVDEHERGRIGALYVLPGKQGGGVGGRIMATVLEWLGEQDCYLNVATYNASAIAFYKQYGFRESATNIGEEWAQIGGGKAIPEISMVRYRPQN